VEGTQDYRIENVGAALSLASTGNSPPAASFGSSSEASKAWPTYAALEFQIGFDEPSVRSSRRSFPLTLQ
jgi:hypothetical protein